MACEKCNFLHRNKCKIRYKDLIYYTNYRDFFSIQRIKVTLLLKRLKRRMVVVLPSNILLYFLLTIAWVIWGLVSYYFWICFKDNESVTVIDLIWNMKDSYFTSVIVMLLISGYMQISNYKGKMKAQHTFYVETLETFDLLFNPFIGTERCYYIPFYNDKCLEDTLSYVKEYEMDKSTYSEEDFKRILDGILNQLNEIERVMNRDVLIGIHEEILRCKIRETRGSIEYELNNISYERLKKFVLTIANDLFYIVADIRRPWRWDEESLLKILRILAEYDENSLKDEFYYSMHLYGHKF